MNFSGAIKFGKTVSFISWIDVFNLDICRSCGDIVINFDTLRLLRVSQTGCLDRSSRAATSCLNNGRDGGRRSIAELNSLKYFLKKGCRFTRKMSTRIQATQGRVVKSHVHESSIEPMSANENVSRISSKGKSM
jgi:hypothetical protein